MSEKLVLLVLLLTYYYNAEAITEERQGYEGNVRANSSYPCPEPEDIAPCTCSAYNPGDNPDLDCSYVESDEQLASVFEQSLPVQEFNYFKIRDNDKITMLGDIFQNVSFADIWFDNVTNLQSISDSLFVNSQNTLQDIEITASKLREDTFPLHILPTMKRLVSIILKGSDFNVWPKIESNTLLEVIFDESPIAELPADSFDLLPHIFSWAMNGNTITTLKANTFRLKNYNNNIVANSNGLTTVEPGTFVLPNTTDNCLINLLLYDNQLRLVEEEVYGDIAPYFLSLGLYGNPLECGCDMAWLVTNPDYVINVYGTCSNGTEVQDLDPQHFINNC